MFKQLPTRLRLSIRTKLLLVSTTLLIIPWVGTQYIQEMEDYLRQQQEEALLTRTQTVASVLQSKSELFAIQTASPLPTRSVQHLYVRPLNNAVQLDGYLDEWQQYADRTHYFDQAHALIGSESISQSFSLQVGGDQKYLYVAIKVKDQHIVYHRPGSHNREDADQLIIALENNDGEFVKYIISTIAPGWVNAYRRLETAPDEDPEYEIEVRIRGNWQQSNDGYTLELRIPITLIGQKIGFAIADVNDNQSRRVESIITTSGVANAASLSSIIFPSPEVEQLLERLQRPLTRTWVIDKHYRVIAQTGALTRSATDTRTDSYNIEKKDRSSLSKIMSLLYSLLLKQPSSEFHDELLNASRLDSQEFRRALEGIPNTRWRQTPDKEVNILTAAHPVFANGQVIGAVAIEQTSNSILLLQNRALEILFNISALAFVLATLILLTFATRLSLRVRRLRDAANKAITSDGRVVGNIATTQVGDEIGDLSRSIADMLERLAQYNRYLETMASKLSHELRTPITVVRSSLDNLETAEVDTQSRIYLDRARDGINRLNNILTRMSEATRLEQTLQSEQFSEFDLSHVIRSCIEGYRLAQPNITFDLETLQPANQQHCRMHGAPELIAQMLDKLISNAIDFHTADTPIHIKLTYIDAAIQLQIQNQGQLLPQAMQSSLFDSMVSVRQQSDHQPHLGLGLYIVRLIVEFHQGTVRAENLPDNSGVRFSLTFPNNVTL